MSLWRDRETTSKAHSESPIGAHARRKHVKLLIKKGHFTSSSKKNLTSCQSGKIHFASLVWRENPLLSSYWNRDHGRETLNGRRDHFTMLEPRERAPQFVPTKKESEEGERKRACTL